MKINNASSLTCTSLSNSGFLRIPYRNKNQQGHFCGPVFVCSKWIKSHYSGPVFCLVTCCRVTSGTIFMLHKSVNSVILEMKRDNRPQGGLAYRYGRNSTRLLVKVWGWIFFLRNNYWHNIRMKVSNAMINIPKAIRSWKSSCFIGITSSLYEGHTTLQHGCHKNYIIKFSFVQ